MSIKIVIKDLQYENPRTLEYLADLLRCAAHERAAELRNRNKDTSDFECDDRESDARSVSVKRQNIGDMPGSETHDLPWDPNGNLIPGAQVETPKHSHVLTPGELAESNHGADLYSGNVPPPPAAPSIVDATQSTTAPVAPSVSLAPQASVELDADGLPWDARIHSRTVSRTADGRWKVKRGVDVALLKKVEKELRDVIAAPAAPAQKHAVPATAPVIPAPPPAETESPYIALMMKITSAIKAGRLTKEQANQAVQSMGVANLVVLPARMDLIPAISMQIDAMIGA